MVFRGMTVRSSGDSRVEARNAVALGVAASALAVQNQYAVPQGQIHGAYWDIAKSLGTDIVDGVLTNESDASLMARLTGFQNSILALGK